MCAAPATDKSLNSRANGQAPGGPSKIPVCQPERPEGTTDCAAKMDCNTCPITNELSALFNVTQVLAHSLDLQHTLSGVLDELQDRGGLRHGIVTLLNPESGELILRAVHDDPVPDRKLEEVRYKSGEGIIGQILEQGETLIVPRIADEPRFVDRLGVYDSEQPLCRHAHPDGHAHHRRAGRPARDRLPGDARRAGTVPGDGRQSRGPGRPAVVEHGRGTETPCQRAQPAPGGGPDPVRLRQHHRPLSGHASASSSRSGPWRSGPRRS